MSEPSYLLSKLPHLLSKPPYGTPTKRQVSKRPVSKRLKRQVYKTSGLQNVWLQKNIHKYSVLVVGGNPQVMLQPCLQAK
jgi:hypothetical protein